MCSIIGSYDNNHIKELCKINNYRGSLSHSITYIKNNQIVFIERQKGPIDLNRINIPFDCYCIIHQQAPTQQSDNIHPAEFNKSYLWHNGILLKDSIKSLQMKTKNDSNWDTLLLLNYLNNHIIPNDIHGSFACIMYDNNKQLFYVFRNDLVSLYVDKDLNISSTYFNGMNLLESNKIFHLDLKLKKINQTELFFKTLENPYYFL